MPPSERTMRGKDPVEQRRARGEISCAECRRHKLKCDKAIPCSSCVRKGCQSICPNGTLAPGQGSRLGAAEAGAFKDKISTMAKRIQQLEDALQISHSSVFSSQHPLLAEDLLAIKNATTQQGPPEKEDLVGVDFLDHFGTLTVTDKGTETYVGGADALLIRHLGVPDMLSMMDSSLKLPASVSYLSRTFPFTPLFLPAQEIQAYIEEKLPSYLRASSLVEAYLENLSWFFRPVDREQITEELIPDIYRRRRQTPGSDQSSPGSSESSVSSASSAIDPHALALLLAVFACGATADLTLPPWNDEADLYYHLARTALSLKPVFEGASLHAVQAIALLGSYELFSCRKGDLEGTWKMMSFALSLAASIGLNRDPAHFNLSPKLIQRRRRVFWELYSVDVWKSLGPGRPATFSPAVVDCEFPDDSDVVNTQCEAEGEDSIWRLRHRYVKEILTDVVSKLGTLRPVKYSEILALDQRIRAFGPSKGPILSYPQGYDSTGMRGLCCAEINLLRDMVLMLIHRHFFARALIEHPDNPMRSQFAPSFLSTYRSATTLLRVTRTQFDLNPHCVMRVWPIWAHALHGATMLGSIAANGSESALAPQAYVEFNLAVEMFLKAQVHPFIKSALAILLTLREQAQQALLRHGHLVPSQIISSPAFSSGSEEENKEFPSDGKKALGNFKADSAPEPIHRVNILQDPEIAAKSPPSRSSPSFVSGPSITGVNAQHSQEHSGALAFGTITEQTWTADRTNTTQNKRDSSGYQHPDQTGRVDASNREREPNTSAFTSGSLMQVDQTTYNPTNLREQAFSPSQFSSIRSPSGLDVFSAFTNFPDMLVDNVGPSNSASPSTFPPAQPPTHVQPRQNPTVQPRQPTFGDPLVYDTSASFPFPNTVNLPPFPRLSPQSAFTSDFDVSFDMRSSTGEESVLPMLPEDMEAWRSLFQDSRFFGIVGNASETSGICVGESAGVTGGGGET